MRLKHSAGTSALAPRIPFWIFATEICGVNEAGAKVQLTPGQAAVWKSYDRQVGMTADEAEAYQNMTGKAPWPPGSKAPPFLLLVLTRGGGKSLLLATIAVYEAVTNPYVAAPGETVAVTAMGPRVKHAEDMLGYACAHLARPALAPFVSTELDGAIVLRNGRSLRVVAADASGTGVRGPTNICVVFDEFAFLGYDGKVIDEDQWHAAVSGARGVTDFRGIMSSTPNGEAGFFWETFDEYHGVENDSWEVMQGPQPIVAPYFSAEYLAEMRRDADRFQREFLCDFSAGSGVEKFFVTTQIDQCVMGGVESVPPQCGLSVEYVCAVDPTGGAHDWMTMVIVERLEDGSVRQCVAKGWDPTISGAATVHSIAKEIAEIVEPYGIRTVYGDVFGGAWVTEAFAAVGLEYETRGFGGPSKVQRASLMRELLATGRIKLLDNATQTRELKEYEKKILHSGAVSVNKPLTKHGSDDFLDSLVLAAWELVGNDTKIHPPDVLIKWDRKKWKKDLFGANQYPSRDAHESDTAAKIIAKGEGPAWVLRNWTKDWRYCQCSLGELSWLCGVGPVQMVGVLGADLALQSAWLRWVLANHQLDIDFIQQTHFVGIPGFEEIKDRIVRQRSADRIVTYDSVFADAWHPGSLPGDWQPSAVKSKSADVGVSKAPAFPPWTAPPKEWGLMLDVEDVYGGWPARPWAAEIKKAIRRR